MPDISKLPELSKILGVSIDELLGEKNPLVEAAAEGNMEEYLERETVTPEVLKEAAPILRPDQVDAAVGRLNESMAPQDLADVAPLMGQEAVENATVQSIGTKKISKLKELRHLAPFVSAPVLDAMVRKALEDGAEISDIRGFAPFLSTEFLDELARRRFEENGSLSELQSLAPFLSSKTMDGLALDIVKKGDPSQRKISDIRQLRYLAPFISSSVLEAAGPQDAGRGRKGHKPEGVGALPANEPVG